MDAYQRPGLEAQVSRTLGRDPKAALSNSRDRSTCDLEGEDADSREEHTSHDPDEDEDDDFMSDAILAQVVAASESSSNHNPPRSYNEKRRKQLHDQEKRARESSSSTSSASRAERERVARNQALSRNLIDQALQTQRSTSSSSKRHLSEWADRSVDENVESAGAERGKPRAKLAHSRPTAALSGPSAALKVMMSMGYEHGRALGKEDAVGLAGPSSPSTAAADIPVEQDVESQSMHAAAEQRTEQRRTGTEPLRVDDRWLEAGPGPSRKSGVSKGGTARYGLGSVTLADLVRSKAAADRARSGARNDGNGDDGAHATAMVDDFRSRQAEAGLKRRAESLLRDARRTCEDLDRQTSNLRYSVLWIDPQLLRPDARPNETDMELLDHAFGADADSVKPDDDDGTIRSEAAERRREAQEFCKLDAVRRLALTTHHLRAAYNYCLFCGCSYDSPEELASQCPGEDEDDH
ncbi:hypothetical protein OC861_003975 [Tilletia horrida]|nr:hypothetical protein OC861_003975 [Tilletia horrida]